ncbi:rho GTPase-activating protein 20-like [Centruroides sculpturatus]|uniref:rho GTPase-activating protein 20-like n=1 Tax=Centruroides sculpturatus TaxID=218467 RepID=UPI000C6D3081|nr:rho GTPase-activating protein 20-like [Centruroides sculpturatus]XP_023229106.1 rho GTPase-activating protein 20-like [Centruroides sculpturatus]
MLLFRLISTSKEKEGKSVTSIQFSLCSQNSRENIGNHYITLKVNNRQTAKDCIKLLLEQLSQNGINEYQLWIKSRKDDAPYPLIGKRSF